MSVLPQRSHSTHALPPPSPRRSPRNHASTPSRPRIGQRLKRHRSQSPDDSGHATSTINEMTEERNPKRRRITKGKGRETRMMTVMRPRVKRGRQKQGSLGVEQHRRPQVIIDYDSGNGCLVPQETIPFKQLPQDFFNDNLKSLERERSSYLPYDLSNHIPRTPQLSRYWAQNAPTLVATSALAFVVGYGMGIITS
ncbi:hypothetical protein CPB83DRAFT_900834 [Crepidotus variabilis]|uniref:Uncharacterized protein n=1 Tax=Crepidotus variabilis TaxID=179855 RepID=A0A9P6E108_9AGAR|nr:hypothetical protein CPB83DRAFT_900834 [Crepidotus variabilis]